jgi:hypothetical protein
MRDPVPTAFIKSFSNFYLFRQSMEDDLSSSGVHGRVLYPLPDEVTLELLQYADPLSIRKIRLDSFSTYIEHLVKFPSDMQGSSPSHV